MKQIGVYQIELNEKKYVGSSSRNIKNRWSDHLSVLRRGTHPNVHLQRAFNIYGEDALIFSILEIVETPEECIIVEQKYIDELKPEYNICKTANSSLGIKRSEETLKKMRNARLGCKLTEEHKRKIGEANKGNKAHKYWLGCKFTEEHKHKISEAGIGNKHTLGHKLSEEHKQSLIAANTGRKITEETRHKLSLAKIGKPKTEEHKQKLRIVNLGKKLSEESKQKMSIARKGKKLSDETKRKIGLASKNAWAIKRLKIREAIEIEEEGNKIEKTFAGDFDNKA